MFVTKILNSLNKQHYQNPSKFTQNNLDKATRLMQNLRESFMINYFLIYMF